MRPSPGWSSQSAVDLTASVPSQNASDFTLVKSGGGKVVTEDGRGRCPFNPEYKSTAIMVGKSRPGLWKRAVESCRISAYRTKMVYV